jgi:hypothetical protein
VVEQARIGDEDVGLAELTVRRGLDLCPVGHVASHRQRAAAEPADLLRRLLGVDEAPRAGRLGERPVLGLRPGIVGLELDVREHDVRTGPRQRERVGAPKAARAPGDERYPPREVDLDAHASRGRKISRAMTSRWICEVPS